MQENILDSNLEIGAHGVKSEVVKKNIFAYHVRSVACVTTWYKYHGLMFNENEMLLI